MEKGIKYLIGKMPIPETQLLKLSSFEIFSNVTIDFLSDISNSILKDSEARNYPDVATFAFFCRRANVNVLKKNYFKENIFKIGRGIIFHITPGNVPVNFAYSLFSGLISGNINIVKVPTKEFEQVNIIIRAISNVLKLKNYEEIFGDRLYIVKYEKENEATKIFSNLCDVRIIWGGDNTINEIRKASIPSKSTELTFSDRYSISVINASSYIALENKQKLAIDFYNDTYLFDQNACTAPQSIYWIGTKFEVHEAQKLFWNLLKSVINDKNFDLQPIVSIDKLTTFFSQAIILENIVKVKHENNDIWRVHNSNISSEIESYRSSSGYFNEFVIQSLDELTNIINRKYQTLSYFGISNKEFLSWLSRNKPIGIDRIVPIGRTMDFSLIWDGFDLVNNLSRQIEIS
jgi:hypothetical protein